MQEPMKGWAENAQTTGQRDVPARQPWLSTPGRSGVGSARHAYTEFVGDAGIDATRYGDWEYSGRCTDF